MRLSELCGLIIEDFEDDGESAFLKVRHGKGAKFRRVPVSSRLRRDLIRYLNRWRTESPHHSLLLRADARTSTGFLAQFSHHVRGFRPSPCCLPEASAASI